jgi:hypothetical protein
MKKAEYGFALLLRLIEDVYRKLDNFFLCLLTIKTYYPKCLIIEQKYMGRKYSRVR